MYHYHVYYTKKDPKERELTSKSQWTWRCCHCDIQGCDNLDHDHGGRENLPIRKYLATPCNLHPFNQLADD